MILKQITASPLYFCLQNDIFEKLMRQYAEKMNLEMEKLTFYFDGDKLKSLSTPEDVDMDDGDCIDVCS